MSNNEAIKMLKARLECVTNLSGDKCSYSYCADCHLCCEQGSLEEQKEYLDIAIKSLEAWEKVDRKLKTIMEGDKRTFSNRETEDGLYYDGIYDAIKIIQKHLSEVSE